MIRLIALLTALAAPNIAVLDVDVGLDANPGRALLQTQSLLAQIETSLAATARQLARMLHQLRESSRPYPTEMAC